MSESYFRGHTPSISLKGAAQVRHVIRVEESKFWYLGYRQSILELTELEPICRNLTKFNFRQFLCSLLPWEHDRAEQEHFAYLVRDSLAARDAAREERDRIYEEYKEEFLSLERNPDRMSLLENQSLQGKIAHHQAAHGLASRTGLSVSYCDTFFGLLPEDRQQILSLEKKRYQQALPQYALQLPLPGNPPTLQEFARSLSPKTSNLPDLPHFLKVSEFRAWVQKQEFFSCNPLDLFLQEQGVQYLSEDGAMWRDTAYPLPFWILIFHKSWEGSGNRDKVISFLDRTITQVQEANGIYE